MKKNDTKDIALNPVKVLKGVPGLQSKTVYNNYLKGMKEINKRRTKTGFRLIPIRSFEEWISDS